MTHERVDRRGMEAVSERAQVVQIIVLTASPCERQTASVPIRLQRGGRAVAVHLPAAIRAGRSWADCARL